MYTLYSSILGLVALQSLAVLQTQQAKLPSLTTSPHTTAKRQQCEDTALLTSSDIGMLALYCKTCAE